MKTIITIFLGIMMTLPYTQAEDRKRVFTKKQMERVVAAYVGDIKESDLGRDEGLRYFYMKAHIEGLIYGIQLVDSVSPTKKPIMSTKENMEIMKDFQKFLHKQKNLKDDADGFSLMTLCSQIMRMTLRLGLKLVRS